MLTILLHSSKTMRSAGPESSPYRAPALLEKTIELANYLRALAINDIQTSMKLSESMAKKTKQLLNDWSSTPTVQRPAIDAFLGDIYSGLQVQSFTQSDREYANTHLFILSGLYGILRALDSVYPYRLEMGYRFPSEPYSNLYTFWGDAIAAQLPTTVPIINLSAVEYTKVVLPRFTNTIVVTPKFLTVNSKTGEPTFVTVHTKIARGAYARWLIQNRIEDLTAITKFDDIGYTFNATLSTPKQPVFVCNEFKGTGLSVRLS